jgi:DMSO/TMAO reductase YedYZ molybdopterin-dependent catalytic subunit
MQSMAITSKIFGERGRRRAESLGIDPSRLPPGQSPTVKWPVLSLGATPRVGTDQWLLSIDGAVTDPYVLDWEQFEAVADAEWHGDIHCVTRWSRFGMDWRGADVAALIRRANPRPEASHLLAHCHGGYTTNLPLSDVLEHRALIAHQVDGVPLPADHGGPARLLVPHLYLWKSAKWVQRLEVLDHDQLGFWERNGYHHRGDPWHEERHSVDDYVARTLRRRARAEAAGTSA